MKYGARIAGLGLLFTFLGCVADVNTPDQLVVISKLGVTVDFGTGAVSKAYGAQVDFGDVAKNSQKSSTFTIRNSGPGPMTFKKLALDPGIDGKPSIFRLDIAAVAELLAHPLAPGASKTLGVSFNPRDNGDRNHNNFYYNATLTMETNDRDFPTYNLSFVGHQTPPIMEVTIAGVSTPSDENLDFGPVQTSTQKNIVIRLINPQGTPLPVSYSVSAPFTVVEGSSGNISQASFIDITLRFSPSALGDQNVPLFISMGAGGALGTFKLNLLGLGVGASNSNLKYSDDGGNSVISLDPYPYGNVDVGQYATQTFWVKNISGSAIAIDSVTSTGDYTIIEVYNGATLLGTAPYTGSLTAGQTYRIKVKFTPSQMGTRTGSVIVASNSLVFQNVLNLSGLATAPILEVEQSSVTYPHQGRAYDFGISNNTQSFNLKNTGTSPLQVSVILSSKPSIFGVTNSTYTIAPNANQLVSVSYNNSTQANRENEIIYILSNSYQRSSYELKLSGGGTTLNLAVTGNANYKDYLLASKAIDLGDRSILGSSNESITITNNEPFAVTLTNNITTTAGTGSALNFTLPAPFTLEPGASATVQMAYTAPGTPELSEKKVVLTDANSRSFTFYGSAINIEPPSTTNLVAWWRSDMIRSSDVTLSSGDPLTTGVKLTGWNATVSNPAQSPTQLTLQNPTVNAQPLYYGNQTIGTLNGRPYIRFDGTTTYLTTSRTPVSQLILNSSTATTYFVVLKTQGTFWSGRDLLNGHNTGSYTRVFPMVSTEAFSKIGPISGFTRFRQTSGSDAVVSNQTEVTVDTPFVIAGISNISRTSTPNYLDDLPLWANGSKQTIKTLRQGFNSLPATPVTWNSNTYWFTSQVGTAVGSYGTYYLPWPVITTATGSVTATSGSPPASNVLPSAGRLNPPVQYPFQAGVLNSTDKAPASPFRGQSVAGGLISTYYTGGISTAVSNFTGMGVDTTVDDQLDPFNPPTYLWPIEPNTYPVGSPLGSAAFDGVQVPSTITMDNLAVGARLTGATTASTFSSIDVMEILLYNRGLSDTEVDTVNNYLKKKYNIP